MPRLCPPVSIFLIFIFVVAAGRLGAAPPAPPRPAIEAGPSARAVHDAVRTHLATRGGDVVRELAALMALPNLASDEAAIQKNAEQIVSMLTRRGLTARLLSGEGGPPAVLGELRTPGAQRTLVIYAHYDGQPVRASDWKGDPWRPVLRDGPLPDGRDVSLETLSGPLPAEWRLYGRSASDDKAPIVGVLAALDALRAAGLAPTVNLKLFFEGEEEAGSSHLRAVLTKHAAALQADAWVFCDGPVHASRRMQLFFGARGVTSLEMTVYGPTRSLHSGHYGGWAPNPAMRLAHLLSSLRDPEGRVLVAGFADDVRKPLPAELAALREVPNVEDALQDELAIARPEGAGARLPELILGPALNVRGLRSGGVGEQAANAVPTEATASIDFRMVPDQTPEKVRARLEAHLRAAGWEVVHEAPTPALLRAHPRVVRLDWGSGYPAYRTLLDQPVSQAVAEVMTGALGTAPLRLPTLGGSLPMHVFSDVLGVPLIGLPIANHDNNQHAANENLRLRNLEEGIQVYAALLTRLAGAWDRAATPRP
jgi:acetylornithine deacetylase/succinyl-diaminopimelate desuccinylase-like protein